MDIPGELIPIILFIVIGYIVKVLSDNHIRQRVIQTGNLNENARYLFLDTHERHVPSSLKWGIVLIAIGLAVLVGQMVPYRISDEVTVSAMFILAGLGLVAYYVIASRLIKKAKDEEMLAKVTESEKM